MKKNVISIIQNKGGCGKTMSTISFAGVFAQQGKRVLIIDMDNQGNSLYSFGMNPDKFETTIYDVLVQGTDPREAIVNVHENIDVLPANDDMGFFEIDVLRQYRNNDDAEFYLLRQALQTIKDEYDLIFIDTPPMVGLNVGNVLNASDYVLIPMNPESFTMRSLTKVINRVKEFRGTNPDLEILGVFGTMVKRGTVLHSDVLQKTREYALNNEVKMFDTTIPSSIRFANSVAYEGKPAVLTDKNNELIQSYFELTEEIAEELAARKERV
jgi:chromosome partitioning protein